ncbi:MAG: AmmeMemoRadiSam system protein B [Betaproteobacteria bacterium]|nr:AmmeMemoRadiSam system protein B [Betaproteobacteria bacterium]
MSQVRPAAVAGMFYPRDALVLQREVADLIDGVENLAPRFGHPKALIVPHAGYIYSGPVAARAYDELAAGRGIVKRVVLLGPVHRVPVRGLALPGVDAFETPLGRVPVDAQGVRTLAPYRQVVTSPAAHAAEHSLEVQLPFLQKMLGEFALVPLAVGEARPQEVREVIERLWGGPETLFVVSTDLSHYHPYDQARLIDQSTLARIATFDTDINHEEACGATPLNGFLAAAKARGLSIRLLGACNSGDTAGGKDRVVGYSSFALYEGERAPLQETGETLLDIARGAIGHKLGLADAPPRTDAAPWLARPGASFVTLHLEGRLRGCIGSLAPLRSLGVDVAENAVAAALRDPRFSPVPAAEWVRCALEVSVLSAPKPLRFADEAELLAQLRPREDGVILEHDGRRATFLPQVWEGLPETRAFLAELMRKAGIPADTRLARCKVLRYRVIKWTQPAPH